MLKSKKQTDKPIKLKPLETKTSSIIHPSSPQTTSPPDQTFPSIITDNDTITTTNNHKRNHILTTTTTDFPYMSKTTNNFRQSSAKPDINVHKRPFSPTTTTTTKVFRPFSAATTKKHVIPIIPSTLIGRLDLARDIFQSPSFLSYYEKCPSRVSTSFDVIIKYLSDYKSIYNDLGIYAMFFYYLCKEFTYDIDKVNETPLKALHERLQEKGNEKEKANEKALELDLIFHSGYADSNFFTKLFEYMCKQARLRCKHIDGYCKHMDLPYFKPGTDISVPNHCWNAFTVKGEWYFCDVLFGSGGIKRKANNNIEYFNPFYFLTPADYLIESHKPLTDDWQRTKKTITKKQFANKRDLQCGDFYKKVYQYNIELVTHDTPVIKSMCTEFQIQIGLENHLIQGFLFHPNMRNKICEVKFSFNDKKKRFTLDVHCPGNGEYVLVIEARSIASTDLFYFQLISYRIIIDNRDVVYIQNLKKKKELLDKQKELEEQEALQRSNNGLTEHKKRATSARIPHTRIITDYNLVLPNKHTKQICLDNKGAYVIEPKSQLLKIGIESKVKVKIREAVAVAVLDNRKFTYLKKKDDDIWEGPVIPQSEELIVCSLKACNVYTEVLKLTAQTPTKIFLMTSRILARREKLKVGK